MFVFCFRYQKSLLEILEKYYYRVLFGKGSNISVDLINYYKGNNIFKTVQILTTN